MNLQKIIKSSCDKRIYKLIKLNNGMKCILIEDKEADKSAASLDVMVGCSLDPKPLYGTAHFLEHMLFMGTNKYPSENEYSQFMQNNGGMNNAYTSLTNTNYHFDCSNEAFQEGLDRFAQFFICPNFSESGAEREMKAVDSEFNQSLQSDGWHFFNLNQKLSKPESLLNRFNCGNLKSLSQPGIRESLLDFHKKWYSSNIMNLTVQSKHDIDILEKWIIEKFSEVENKNVTVPDLGTPFPYPKENLGKFVKYVPVQDKDVLTLLWVLPYLQKDIKAQPLGYYSFLFGHEGQNSLMSYLKSEGLASELSAGGDHELFSFSTFQVDITLTQKGLNNYEQVIEAVFQYAQRLKQAGPQKYIYKENYDLGLMQFDFQDKKNSVNYCVGLSSKLHLLDETNYDQILRSQFIIDEFNEQKIQDIADKLCDYNRMNILLRSKQFENQTNEVEEWYQTKYSVSNFTDKLIQIITNPNIESKKSMLDLPPKNNLIPTNFEILQENIEFSDSPKLLISNKNYDLWYKKDDKFKRPKSFVSMKMYTPDCLLGVSPNSRVFINLWTLMLNEYLREFNYMANCANMNLEVSPLYDSISLQWSGFNHTMPDYINQTIDQILKMQEEQSLQEMFEQVKEKLMQDLKNLYLEQSYQQAFALFDNLMINAAVEQKQIRKLLEKYTYEDFLSQQKQWLKSGRQIWYITGNFDHEQAQSLVEQTQLKLKLEPIKIEDLAPIRTLALDEGHSFLIERELEDKSNENSCIITYYEAGLNSDDQKLYLTNLVIMQFLSEPFFNDLRTQQQLGYVVFSKAVNTRGVIGSKFVVQSPTKSCEYIVQSVNNFLINMREQVKNISDEDFEIQKLSVLTKLQEKDYSLRQENNRFWNEINIHKYDFKRQQKQIEELQKIKKKEFQDLFEMIYFSKESKRIDLQLTSEIHKEEQEEYKQKNNEHEIFKNVLKRVKVEDSIVQFKKESGMHPDIYKSNYVKFLKKF